MSESDDRVPVLLLGYNRPELIIRRLKELSVQEIGHLTISIDGGGMTELELQNVVVHAAQLFHRTNFDFVVHGQNLGLCKHIVSAISKALTGSSFVIVLEDDISVGPNFYSNMIAGIELSKRINGIAAITSFTALGASRLKFVSARWRQTRYFSCWGWAISRDAWEKYQLNLADIDISKELSKSVTWGSLNSHQKSVWHGRFTRVKENPSSTWDIQFQFMCFRFDYKILAPTRRFSSNQGFNDVRGQHTTGRMPRWMLMSKRYAGAIPAKQNIWGASIYEKIFDQNTIAGDGRFNAKMRNFRDKFFKDL